MILSVIVALTSSSLAAPIGITAGIGVIFWAGLALFREVRRVNKADTLMDAYVTRVETDNVRLRNEKELLEKRIANQNDRIETLLKRPREGEK